MRKIEIVGLGVVSKKKKWSRCKAIRKRGGSRWKRLAGGITTKKFFLQNLNGKRHT